jgi:hypothetical protein
VAKHQIKLKLKQMVTFEEKWCMNCPQQQQKITSSEEGTRFY